MILEAPNLDYIKKLSGGDTEFEQKLISVIKDEFPGERAEYDANIDNKDYLMAAQNVHKLKHKFSILGLEQSYRLAEQFEDDLKNSVIERSEAFNTVLYRISAFLEQI